MKHKAILYSYGGMLKWGVDYWETYNQVVNWISVSSLLAIASIHEFTRRSIDCVLTFPQYDLDVDVFMEVSLGMGIYRNIREWFLKLNK